MKQSELLKKIRDYLAENIPPSWRTIVGQVAESYSVFIRFENLGESISVAILPASLEWERLRGEKPITVHEIDVVIFGKEKNFETFVTLMDGLEELAEVFMNDGGPFNETECVGVKTIDAAKAGYDKSKIHRTGEPFVGGIRLTFRA
ncbi:MAG: hypothetical protein LBT05_08430 [Planctomycetaceae bacterium]|jgi:hypothetical protein|nr:hypothetical protein [Planctomycetaceae bacterium]